MVSAWCFWIRSQLRTSHIGAIFLKLNEDDEANDVENECSVLECKREYPLSDKQKFTHKKPKANIVAIAVFIDDRACRVLYTWLGYLR